MSHDIPEEAKCTADLDCVLLTYSGSYRAQLVRLAACEKGINWKHYEVNITSKLDNLEPWYVNLNPGAYVPTMLVGVENKPICESAAIINYIDREFKGKTKLQSCVEADPKLKERYETFEKLHEDWDVEPISFGGVMENNFMVAQLMPVFRNNFFDKIEKLKSQQPEGSLFEKLYQKKIYSK